MQSKKETERKYLLNYTEELHNYLRLNADELTFITQVYLATEVGFEMSVRRQESYPSNTIKYVLTIKKGSGLTRDELDVEISASVYYQLPYAVSNSRYVFKTRIDNAGWSIDRYNQDLATAEFEFDDETQEVIIPDWLKPFVIREVTFEPLYHNSNLAITSNPNVSSLYQWEEWLANKK